MLCVTASTYFIFDSSGPLYVSKKDRTFVRLQFHMKEGKMPYVDVKVAGSLTKDQKEKIVDRDHQIT